MPCSPEVEDMPMPIPMDITEKITSYVFNTLITGIPNIRISQRTSLLGSRIVDSLGILEIIEYIEREFGISVEEEEMIPENLDSIENLSRFIQHKIEG
jgi:acyl carrier protein